jgi:hypothetical protein
MSALSIPIQSSARSACICCGSARWKEYFRALRKCRDCGFIRADIDLTHEQVRKLYQEDYFQGEEYGDYLADAVSHGKNFAARLAVARQTDGQIMWVHYLKSVVLMASGYNNVPWLGYSVLV